jgi:archaetidylinositol phosphate synthase
MEAAAAMIGGRRELSGLTSAVEKRVLVFLAERMPARVNADHLTALGFLAMVVAGAAYAAVRIDLRFLYLVNLCLFLNWFGDSLDGTLARVRQKLRPRYGFYVDHVVDALGVLCLLLGLAASGLMHPVLAVALLVAYYLLSIHIFLATHTQGVFKISYGAVGGTELRLILAALNLLALAAPPMTFAGVTAGVLDIAGGAVLLGLLWVTGQAIGRTTRDLYRLEKV